MEMAALNYALCSLRFHRGRLLNKKGKTKNYKYINFTWTRENKWNADDLTDSDDNDDYDSDDEDNYDGKGSLENEDSEDSWEAETAEIAKTERR